MYISFSTSIIISYALALIAIAFYTLLERKLLGYYQLRKGPNKIIFIGLPQPFADAIKLFLKEQTTKNNQQNPIFTSTDISFNPNPTPMNYLPTPLPIYNPTIRYLILLMCIKT